MPALCRDCLTTCETGRRCPACKRPRIVAHPELFDLTIAHLDCDALYASVEKRDDPTLRDQPVIIGGGRRGVVSTACYIAQIKSVRSAMPMFQALKLCPEAVVVRGRVRCWRTSEGQCVYRTAAWLLRALCGRIWQITNGLLAPWVIEDADRPA